MKENISIGVAVLAIAISIAAVVSTVIVSPQLTIAANSIGKNELKDDSVTSSKVVDGALTDEDISDTGISKIANNAIGSDQIIGNSIMLHNLNSEVLAAMTGIVEIVNGTITNAHISDSADINPSKILGTAWTAANDGADSGLDADKLDGIDGSKFLRNDVSGVIEGDLTVEGSITHKTEVRYYSIPASAFVGRYHTDPYTIWQGALRNTELGVTHYYYAPVNLPHGANITNMTVGYNLDTDGEMGVQLQYHYIESWGVQYIAGVSCIPEQHRVETSVDHIVDNNGKVYEVFLRMEPNDSSADAEFKGVVITYTVTNPLP